MGHALHTVTLREDTALKERLEAADAAEYPDAAQALKPTRDHSSQPAFNEALESILDGIEHRFTPLSGSSLRPGSARVGRVHLRWPT
jgi:hypothetical protein